MKKIILFFGLTFFLLASTYAQEEISKTFDKQDLKIKLVLGDCKINKSNDSKIHVKLLYTYDDEKFEAIFKEKTRYVEVSEKFHGENPRGYSKWSIDIPNGIEVDFKSATGDLFIENVDAEIDGNTGTGEIELRAVKGQFDLNTGTGNVEITESEGEFDMSSGTGSVLVEDSKGNFDLSSGTGDVEANNLTIEDEGDFSCGTGDVEVVSPKGNGFDLTISSGTDDATLDMKGSSIQGYFEFTAHKRRGRINCPIQFDEEKEYEEGDNTYMRKSFTKGTVTNRFYIKTGTGRAKMKK